MTLKKRNKANKFIVKKFSLEKLSVYLLWIGFGILILREILLQKYILKVFGGNGRLSGYREISDIRFYVDRAFGYFIQQEAHTNIFYYLLMASILFISISVIIYLMNQNVIVASIREKEYYISLVSTIIITIFILIISFLPVIYFRQIFMHSSRFVDSVFFQILRTINNNIHIVLLLYLFFMIYYCLKLFYPNHRLKKAGFAFLFSSASLAAYYFMNFLLKKAGQEMQIEYKYIVYYYIGQFAIILGLLAGVIILSSIYRDNGIIKKSQIKVV